MLLKTIFVDADSSEVIGIEDVDSSSDSSSSTYSDDNT